MKSDREAAAAVAKRLVDSSKGLSMTQARKIVEKSLERQQNKRNSNK